ncbi:hypothetical protein M422DRAFT_253990 [Sphaerobolus stellatus SS14]|uniref:DDE Tnp4 domain-containing protein n=1 Tax=Sphaerobolus stellatus (strain SS14) TaxID=990650 RepID=A0A0C9V7B2_SPHS4|nr:hypothetical protein M422DRAFT_253990 [Sphaerobolus stellatus SS14]
MPRQTDCQVLTEEVLVLFTQQLLTEEQESLNNLLYEESNDSDSDDGEDIPAPQLTKDLNTEDTTATLADIKSTFDILIQTIQGHSVFHNRSKQQDAVTLQKVGLWVGFGYGTVDLCTKRIMATICDAGFRWAVMQWPTEKQKEDAKAWIESRSCLSWCDGWLMVDGTLVPLFTQPGFYGNSWYDRKSNYSLNVQLISTPNLHIIDYEHGTLFRAEEWVWADMAYPLQTWCQAPYKKPEKDTALTGQWSSLRGLRLHINNPRHIHLASIWITSCIVLHNFAMQHEEDEDIEGNEFYREGLALMERERSTGDREATVVENSRVSEANHDVELLLGQLKREELKEALFNYLDT